MTANGLGTKVVMQVGVVVYDIEAAARQWADVFGLPMPEIIVTDTEDRSHTRYCGQPSEARAKLAFFNLGVDAIAQLGVVLELLKND